MISSGNKKNPYSPFFRSREYREIIERALVEDRAGQDVTTDWILSRRGTSPVRKFQIIQKADGVCAGLRIVRDTLFFARRRSNRISFQERVSEGKWITSGTCICSGKAPIRTLLAAERTALNFLGHLSGIATLTYRFIEFARPAGVRIFDTRKTLPGLRIFEKFAVRVGGGNNHRLSLEDAIFIKDNHRVLVPDFENLLKRIHRFKIFGGVATLPLILEVENPSHILPALRAGCDVILLDNFTPGRIRAFLKKNPLPESDLERLEISGGVNLKNLRRYLDTGIRRISIGALTHSAPSLDFSLEVLPL